jgi:hypothetical protein
MKRMFVITLLLLLTAVYAFGQDKEQVVSFLHENDDRHTKFNSDIILIEEFNFGIPGGKNWLVVWEDRRRYEGHQYKTFLVFVYVVDIDGRELKFRESVLISQDENPYDYLSYYQSLPGVTVDGICQVGDFNSDGFDDVLSLLGSKLAICGFPSGRKTWYCGIPYGLVDGGNGQPPVEFINYNGEKGFKLYFEVYEVAGGVGWVPDPHPDNGKWIFYSWSNWNRRFVKIEEVEEDGIESLWFVDVKEIQVQIIEIKETVSQETEEKNPQSVIDTKNQTETVVENDAEEGSMPLWALVAIIGGVVAIAGSTALFVVKRRK